MPKLETKPHLVAFPVCFRQWARLHLVAPRSAYMRYKQIIQFVFVIFLSHYAVYKWNPIIRHFIDIEKEATIMSEHENDRYILILTKFLTGIYVGKMFQGVLVM